MQGIDQIAIMWMPYVLYMGNGCPVTTFPAKSTTFPSFVWQGIKKMGIVREKSSLKTPYSHLTQI